jgi:hypothetical protein
MSFLEFQPDAMSAVPTVNLNFCYPVWLICSDFNSRMSSMQNITEVILCHNIPNHRFEIQSRAKEKIQGNAAKVTAKPFLCVKCMLFRFFLLNS